MNEAMTNQQMIDEVVHKIYEKYPQLKEQFGEKGLRKCREDNVHHFRHLDTAFELTDVQFFVDYAHWLNGILQKHGMTVDHLCVNFEIIQQVVDNWIDADRKVFYDKAIDQAVLELRA
ncbi:hypothetical protein [Pseudalkalibacillus sp. SCS-8]|uniref:hypothetical protein n=1 Tax=Pseudalkalibacillus nanhaiensis TaxID=3115291 RepID=UPI0032DAD192